MSKERIVRKIMIISSSDMRSSSLLQYALEGRNHRQHLPAYMALSYHAEGRLRKEIRGKMKKGGPRLS